jgi:diadenylate cyclase
MTGALAAFGWRDALDVLLVGIVVYRLLVMFRGTRAIQMAVGLGALMAASLVAQRLRLQSLQWLIGHFWAVWGVVLVVLFQPELRRALARVGQGGILQNLLGTARAARAHVVDEVVSVADTLSGRRIGALIVVERATGLRQYAELGVPLDALVSADLLGCLFLPTSPLHDGAVLVQGTRVVAAGCFLPLSRNLQVGRALGTRHRAALGISEETDAVAVVVSEESGRISLAVDAQIERPPDPETLRRRLQQLVGAVAEPTERRARRRGLRRLLPRPHDNV